MKKSTIFIILGILAIIAIGTYFIMTDTKETKVLLEVKKNLFSPKNSHCIASFIASRLLSPTQTQPSDVSV